MSATFDVQNPATGARVESVPNAGVAEARAAARRSIDAFPGWRDLPILPNKLRGGMGTRTMTPQLQEWFDANYPAEFRVDGAPIRTLRGRYGTRHVPNYSPFGGYDLSVGLTTALPQ